MPTNADDLIELFEGLYEADGYEVRYLRGAAVFTPLRAIKGGRNAERFSQFDQQLYATASTDDFIVLVSEFRALIGTEVPHRKDRIEWTNHAGDTNEYVVGVDGLEDAFRDSGSHGVMYRIHTHRRSG